MIVGQQQQCLDSGSDIWPLGSNDVKQIVGMGIRLSKSARRRQVAREDAAGTSSGSVDSDDGRELAPPELLLFLETASGARWLAGILLDLPEHMHNLRVTTLAEVNHFVIKQYKKFVSSDIGHRMIRSPQQQQVAQQDTLALPVYIIEDLVRQRLKTSITSTYWSAGVFLATRTPFLCAAVHFTKHLIKKYLLRPHRQGRHRRLVHAATVVLDQLLPTAFYGPLLTYGLLVRKLMKELDGS